MSRGGHMKLEGRHKAMSQECPFLQFRLAEDESIRRAERCLAVGCRWFERGACRFATLCVSALERVPAA